jgi:cob(I)alamin adenosyltransferase
MNGGGREDRGLLMVFTGNGKGKTTAALGQAFRALGHGFRICMIQFVKGSWKYGELDTAGRFAGLMEVHVMGRGFTWQSDDPGKDIAAARQAWEYAREVIGKGEHRMVILDELTYLVAHDVVDEQAVVDTLQARPPGMHVIVTGRGATEGLIAAADLVTEMVAVKHPYDRGVKAQKGIEY